MLVEGSTVKLAEPPARLEAWPQVSLPGIVGLFAADADSWWAQPIKNPQQSDPITMCSIFIIGVRFCLG